jgi:hypothetical protein
MRERLHLEKAHVIDEDVELPTAADLFDYLGGTSWRGQVADGDGGAGECRGDGFRLRAIAAVDDDMDAFGGERLSDSAADPFSGASDQARWPVRFRFMEIFPWVVLDEGGQRKTAVGLVTHAVRSPIVLFRVLNESDVARGAEEDEERYERDTAVIRCARSYREENRGSRGKA